jgi:ADP-ribose pyrophosphatase YjhB (NUDIX family)
MANTKLMNMCMIMDKDHQRVIVQDKINGNWTGITFPGGKVEKGEGIIESTIREVKEETGLEVTDLQFSCKRQVLLDKLGVRTKTWTYKSGGSPCIPTRNE